jgi:hypothetical protein
MLPEFAALQAAAADKPRVVRNGLPQDQSIGRSCVATLSKGARPQGLRHKARKGELSGDSKDLVQDRAERVSASILLGVVVAVFVLDRQGKAVMPCSEKRARLLLERGRARIHRLMPFVIRLVDRQAASCVFQPLRVKLDPGSKTTGLALVRDVEAIDTFSGEIRREAAVLNLFELLHRGRQISEVLTARRAMRRRRRSTLRYRAPRFLNRGNSTAVVPPSLQNRVDTTLAWVKRLHPGRR